MAEKINVGDRYGALEVIQDMHVDKNHMHYYMCKCHTCGRVSKINRKDILKNANRMGCKVCYPLRAKNHSGIEFGVWKALYKTERTNKSRNSIWVCQCERCGRTKEIPTNFMTDADAPLCDCQIKNKLGNSHMKLKKRDKTSIMIKFMIEMQKKEEEIKALNTRSQKLIQRFDELKKAYESLSE